MKKRWLIRRGGRLLAVLLAACVRAAALADDVDPPARAARLSDVQGPVSLEPAGVAEWTAATLNRPLTGGDRLWADDNARAELDLGNAAVRLGAHTAFAFFELDDTAAQMQLTGGVLIVRVRDLAANQVYEIDTPNLSVSLQQAGEYRLEVNGGGDVTTVKVADGAAQALGGSLWLAIGAGESVTFSGTTTLTYSASRLAPADDLDAWSEARDQGASSAAAYLPSDLPGAADLEANGSWQQSPDYGEVWIPTNVVAGWAPYRFGRWLWVSPWGWTWVDDAHWGYAPFHYGRWVHWRDAWCWVPGSRLARPVYAPALVGWLSGTAEVGWFPLGPREPYAPRAPVSAAYLRRVNLASNAAVSDTDRGSPASGAGARYLNAHAMAVSRVPRDVFTSAQQVNARLLQTPPPSEARPQGSAPAIAPIRQSVLGLAQGRGAVRPPAQEFARSVVARRTPPPAPLPFDELMAALQASDGSMPTRAAAGAPRAPLSAVRLVVPAGAPVMLSEPHAAARRAPAPLGLAARERLLEQPRIAGSMGARARPPVAVAQVNAFVPPALSEDDTAPPISPPHAVTAPAGKPSGVDAVARQSAEHPPAAPAAHAGMTAPTSRSGEPPPPRAPATAAPSSSLPVHDAHPSAPNPSTAQHPPGRESRDGAPHADRASRERAVR